MADDNQNKGARGRAARVRPGRRRRQRRQRPSDRQRRTRLIIWVVVLAVVGWVLFQTLNPPRQTVTYSQIRRLHRAGSDTS